VTLSTWVSLKAFAKVSPSARTSYNPSSKSAAFVRTLQSAPGTRYYHPPTPEVYRPEVYRNEIIFIPQRPAPRGMALEFHLADNARQHITMKDNATLTWPETRKHFDAGTLTITQATPQQKGVACEPINFDPLVMADGIAPTNDPILLIRSPAYAVSYGKRLSGK
jgi:hypothetical protein